MTSWRGWQNSTLASELGVEDADEDELYSAMDWLLQAQPKLEAKLAERHLSEGGLVLYDLTSVYLEGSKCELAKRGYSRDGKRGLPQIEFGLLTNREGCPVAVDVFEGNLADPNTVAAQVDKLKNRFGIAEVVMVGDRGMLTSARIEALKEVGGIGWISALRSNQIEALVNSGHLQLSLFDQRNLIEISSPRFPGERLVVCKNPATGVLLLSPASPRHAARLYSWSRPPRRSRRSTRPSVDGVTSVGLQGGRCPSPWCGRAWL